MTAANAAAADMATARAAAAAANAATAKTAAGAATAGGSATTRAAANAAAAQAAAVAATARGSASTGTGTATGTAAAAALGAPGAGAAGKPPSPQGAGTGTGAGAGSGSAKKKKRKSKKPVAIGISAALLLCMGWFAISHASLTSKPGKAVTYVTLEKGVLTDKISTKGTVQSAMKKNVYSPLSATVRSVDVTVGDTVSEGQILCRLDTEEIEASIESHRIELDNAKKSGHNQLESSVRAYDTAAESLKNGKNAGILNAESALKSSEASLKTAQKAYSDALDDQRNATGSGKASAQIALRNAESDLAERRTELDANRKLFDAGAVAHDALAKSESAYNSALSRFNDAKAGAKNADTAESRAIEQARSALESAQIAHSNAKSALAAAHDTAAQELERFKSGVESAQISASLETKVLAIQKLEKQLESATVTAPAAGVVTAIYAKVGAPGSGLLFVVEDTGRLMVKTKIKEFDSGRVAPGMRVVIRNDAFADREFSGVLASIDPTAIKNASGETESTTDVEFAAMVSVTQADTPLKIGMNARMNIIVKEKKDIYFVPLDSVASDEDGGDIIFAVADDGSGKHLARKIAVHKGMQTDAHLEVEGDGIADGAMIIKDVAESGVHDGEHVTLPGA
jgi:multidrug efflux pump subunit AcrA (membrane-fusion protein)